MSAQWTTQQERGSPAALGLILWIALHLGRHSARVILYPITLYFLLKAKSQRIASRLYLSRVLGRPASLLQIMRHIHCFAATILDRVFFLTGRFQGLDVQIHNAHLITERVASKQGVLLLGSHLGSFEAIRALGISRERIPLKILMSPEHNRIITGILHTLNPEVAESVIPLGSLGTAMAVKENLDSGVVVGLLGDRFDNGESHVHCRFFGAQAPFPTGPMALAAATRVPVVLFFCLYRGGNRYDIHFEMFAERVELDAGQRTDSLRDWTQKYANRLEHYTRDAPDNWFNFYDFWEECDDGSQ